MCLVHWHALENEENAQSNLLHSETTVLMLRQNAIGVVTMVIISGIQSRTID